MWVWEAECPYSWLGGPTVGTWVNYGVAGTSICQPASITAIQTTELPSSKELAHRSDLRTVFLAGLPGLQQCQLLGVLQVVHPTCGKAEHLSAIQQRRRQCLPQTRKNCPMGVLLDTLGGRTFLGLSPSFLYSPAAF